ncbi:MAG TPA: cob(I)yrinic acid a,c-diamide adenosyltransferase [Caldilineae bacterium]|nr:cob(I)yrinic acid a,c-diamide adenosyltransferase [Caldilineae bacterium]
MKIYTKTGDLGETGLFGGRRVPKHHLRIEAYGTVDETNAMLGLAASRCSDSELLNAILRVQSELFSVGSDLATPLDVQSAHIVRVDDTFVQRLEREIDAWEETLPALKNFILPGGNESAATLHVARTICRRAERAVTALAEQEAINPVTQRYLNRLADWLFVLARTANHRAGNEETGWSG